METLSRWSWVALGTLAGFFVAGAVTFFIGRSWVGWVEERYPSCGDVSVPSVEALFAVVGALLATLLMAVVGGMGGAFLTWRRVRPVNTDHQH